MSFDNMHNTNKINTLHRVPNTLHSFFNVSELSMLPMPLLGDRKFLLVYFEALLVSDGIDN